MTHSFNIQRLNQFFCLQEKNFNGNIEQRFSVQRDQLEETKIQLRDQGRKMQEQVAITKRLETELSLLRAELENKE